MEPLNPHPKRYTILFRAPSLIALNTLPDYDAAVRKLGYMALLDNGKLAFYNNITDQFELVADISGSGSHALDDLTDVSVPAPNLGDFLYWNGSYWTSTPIAISLDEITDVNAPAPIIGDVLYYDGVEWINTSLANLIPSLLPVKSKAHYSWEANASATTISVIGTFYKMAGTSTPDITQDFTLTNNRATYIGTVTKNFRISAIFSANDGANKQLAFRIGKDGITISNSQVSEVTHAPAENVSSAIQDIVNLSTGQYVEIFVTNLTTATNVTIPELSVIIEEF